MANSNWNLGAPLKRPQIGGHPPFVRSSAGVLTNVGVLDVLNQIAQAGKCYATTIELAYVN